MFTLLPIGSAAVLLALAVTMAVIVFRRHPMYAPEINAGERRGDIEQRTLQEAVTAFRVRFMRTRVVATVDLWRI
ncbi:hypothetical protein LX15_001936 [Streptoalloteichus tenebrarius]|uniref:Uncharacterized protein n=1 Tax=Streptoalloteichus tenebrarius (strain ATCC 17920 / DSM 40477 / JCM 4838 / CBS 697.72 / NBRC 16177 / NCIMB 11028 / NRRL B-12390 / A12253. 1 / ISP 5477) TaxID=1933 RepID=A0ABT1HRV6_STRSD|nr:hypothetical protein [Streptoalloteichus tenebrarius]MCP2258242.1 hypothetical protein [Streptoalloteichus tenebrarius]BFF04527.1 hypothetical protein GCM10020241_62020 [Streptoalloteichus tenebrarius]